MAGLIGSLTCILVGAAALLALWYWLMGEKGEDALSLWLIRRATAWQAARPNAPAVGLYQPIPPLYISRYEGRFLRSGVKTAAVGLLALAALIAGGSPWLVIGLICGAIGDFFLSRPAPLAFTAGLSAFLLGHLAYLGLILTHGADLGRLAQMPQALAAVALIALCAGMAALLWRAAGDLRGPVLGYVTVIGAMGLAALALPCGHGGQGAAALFIASDLLLALGHFGLLRGRGPRQAAAFAVWPLYWLAQALFLMSFAFQIPV